MEGKYSLAEHLKLAGVNKVTKENDEVGLRRNPPPQQRAVFEALRKGCSSKQDKYEGDCR